MKTHRVVLADDHNIMRQGLKSLIEAQPGLQVVGEAAEGRTALKLVKELRPDVLVMDISMPELNGLQVMEQLRQALPDVRVVVLTAFSDTAYIRQMLAAGAAGFVLKQAAAEDLILAIRTVLAGGTHLDPAVAGKVVAGFIEQKKLRGSRAGDELSEREREVAQAVAQGYTNKEIAAQLRISVKTVEAHKANFMEKLDLHSRAEIVRYALRQGWLSES